jgi:hypothetical protein
MCAARAMSVAGILSGCHISDVPGIYIGAYINICIAAFADI